MSAVCIGFGSCIVSIFPCSASALGLGRPFFMSLRRPNPNPTPMILSLHTNALYLCIDGFVILVACFQHECI
ncbi:uncharacterized protein B0H18DRAFT_1159697 [Fomitopsis serialis]|uniref:uncharacterized protein n=1 Tax=Fomitopsis serialis TaxID=139415 RepID=UPI0020086A54|nr:uncharacterized protein B0H18DRAFT_1159697 [Neoantrodia serialis]KAH9927746.1 hypothetical protein B0H18DRAFT_1159697 [Neoantrodia serialis]